MAPRDIELNPLSGYKTKEDSFTHGSSYSMHDQGYVDEEPPSYQRFFHSFRRDPNTNFIPGDHLDPLAGAHRHHSGSHYYDLHLATLENAHIGLARKLKGRHLQMIAIGGSIGTGLFVVSGKSLSSGGPASLLIAFSIVGAMLFCTCQALGELAVIYPLAGSFSSWATRFLDPSWGFAMGWKCVYSSFTFYNKLKLTTQLRDAMVGCSAARNHCCVSDYRILGRETYPSHLHHCISLYDCIHQHVWY